MLDTLKRLWDNIYTRIGLIVVASVLVLWLLEKTQLAWGSFLIAFAIAYIANPLVTWFENKRFFSRSLGVILVLSFILFIFVVGILLLINIIVEISTLAEGISISPLINWVRNLPEKWPQWLGKILSQNTESVNNLLQNLQNFLQQEWPDTVLPWLQDRMTGFLRGIGGFLGVILQSILIFILVGYILASYPTIVKDLLRIIPPRQQPLAKELTDKLDIVVGGYIRAKVIEALIVGLVTWLSLSIIGVPSALSIGFVAALLNPIPYLGPIIATIPAVLLAIGEGWTIVVITGVVMIIIQQLDGNVLGPLLLSQSMQVHPVTVLVALIVGSSLFGFWGILLAIPATAFFQLLYNDYYLTSKWYRAGEITQGDELEM